MRTRIKICGITRAEDAQAAVDAGADALGFVFWPGSPRCVELDRVAAIVRNLPAFVAAVGVFVNQPLDEIRAAAEATGLDAIQLQGDEPIDVCARVPRRCIKAIGMGAGFDAADLAWWPPAVLPLLDVHDPLRRGGTGRVIHWGLAAAASRIRRVVLAGGLDPHNIQDAVREVRPFAVDVSSGVEHEPGIKDHARLRAFVEGVRAADASNTP